MRRLILRTAVGCIVSARSVVYLPSDRAGALLYAVALGVASLALGLFSAYGMIDLEGASSVVRQCLWMIGGAR